MLLYSRVSPRPSCLKPIESSSGKEQQTTEVVQVEQLMEEQSVELDRADSSQSISSSGSKNSEPKDSVQMDVFPSTSVSDDVEMADTILSLSSPQDMGVFSGHDLTSEKEIVSSSVDTDGLEFPHSEAGISGHDMMHCSTENSQCSENGYISISEQNHCDSEILPDSNDSKFEQEKLETENGFMANGAKAKPFLTPGFLGKRPSDNSTKRRGKCPSNVSEFAHLTEPLFVRENLQAKNAQNPHPE